MMRLIKLIVFTAVILSSTNISISQASSATKYTVCYFPFDIDRYVPYSELSIHIANCYAISDDEFRLIDDSIKKLPPPDEAVKYDSQNLKVKIFNDATTIYIDYQGVVKIGNEEYKNAGVKKTEDLIRPILKGKRSLPRKKL